MRHRKRYLNRLLTVLDGHSNGLVSSLERTVNRETRGTCTIGRKAKVKYENKQIVYTAYVGVFGTHSTKRQHLPMLLLLRLLCF